MSMAKRWLETLPEFDEVVEVEFDILPPTEQELTIEVRDWLQWLAYDDDGEAIESDYDWIRRGC